MLSVDKLTRVSWSCIHFATQGEVSAQLREAIAATGLRASDLNGEAVRTETELLRGLAQAMSFPGYFGMNWDAAEECLRDLPDHVPAKGHVLFVTGSAWLWQRCRPAMGKLIEVWLGAAEQLARDGMPLHLVLMESPTATAIA